MKGFITGVQARTPVIEAETEAESTEGHCLLAYIEGQGFDSTVSSAQGWHPYCGLSPPTSSMNCQENVPPTGPKANLMKVIQLWLLFPR